LNALERKEHRAAILGECLELAVDVRRLTMHGLPTMMSGVCSDEELAAVQAYAEAYFAVHCCAKATVDP